MNLEELYFENEKLVHFILNTYFFNSRFNEDLQQEGRLGLWKACLTFDRTKGYTFSSYASRCIYNEIGYYLRKTKNDYLCVSINAPISENCIIEDILEGDVGIDVDEYDQFCKKLTPSEKIICDLRLIGYTQAYIAKVLGVTKSAISKRLKNIRKKFE